MIDFATLFASAGYMTTRRIFSCRIPQFIQKRITVKVYSKKNNTFYSGWNDKS